MECNICHRKFRKRSDGKLAKRTFATFLRNEEITALDAMQQLYNDEVVGLLLD